jgi:HEAT repeat protein
VPGDPVTQPVPDLLTVITAGHRHDAVTARRGLDASDPRVREAALGALARAEALGLDDVLRGQSDAVPAVRRRACDVAARLTPDDELRRALLGSLYDDDALVVEAACWALGELATAAGPAAVAALGTLARTHGDTRAREAAVAALGAIGDVDGLPAVLHALGDKPTVRRRAVVALAAFEGDEVRQAIMTAASDRDWQVREVAEILLDLDDGQEPEEEEPA